MNRGKQEGTGDFRQRMAGLPRRSKHVGQTHNQTLKEARGLPISISADDRRRVNRRLQVRIGKQRLRSRRPKRQVVDEVKESGSVRRGQPDCWRVVQEDVEKKGCIQQGRRDDKDLQDRGTACRIKNIETMLGYVQRAKICCASKFLVLNVDIGRSDKTKTSVSNYFLIVLSCVTVGRPVSGLVIR